MLHRTRAFGVCGSLLPAMGLLAGLWPASAFAEPSCLSSSLRNSRSELDGFKLDPVRFISDLRGDSTKIGGLVSNIVASDPEMMTPLKTLIAYASSEQRRAVGMGLANAARRCLATRPAINSEIEKYVAKLGDSSVTAGFYATGDGSRVVLPPISRPRQAAGVGLIEGEDGEKLADPFAEVPVP